MHDSLTVVMPAYNEAEGMASAVDEVRSEILDRFPRARLLVVNDGSKDRTGAILDEQARDDARVHVLHKPNGGHGSAIRAGLDAAHTDYVFLVDSDQQIPLSAFSELAAAIDAGHTAAFGVRRRRHDPRLRLALTAFIRRALRLLFGVTLYDANVPFKLLRREHWLAASPLIPPDTLAPSLFLALHMRVNGVDIAEVDVPHRERETGEVSIRRWRLFRFCTTAFGQLWAFRSALRARSHA